MESITLEVLLEFTLQALSKYAISGLTVGSVMFLIAKLYIERKIKEVQAKRNEELKKVETEKAKAEQRKKERQEHEQTMYVLRRERDRLESRLFEAWSEVISGCVEIENKPATKKSTNLHAKLQEKNEEIKKASLAWEAKQKKEQ